MNDEEVTIAAKGKNEFENTSYRLLTEMIITLPCLVWRGLGVTNLLSQW